ncbi:hypothetical protein CHISP_0752 [Chitinispirillum alkaliphilum]|nr:hypothetical protein CHISP_0752 [Chitinispirillum alkaliphilum]
MISVLYYRVNQSGFISGLAGYLNVEFESYRNLIQFEEEEKGQIRGKLAGLWEFSQGDPDSDAVSKVERLELNENGIVWHVIHWTLNLPSGEQVNIAQGRHGYYEPFSFSHDESVIYCEAWVIRQAFANEKDTCYGESQVLEMWEFDIRDDVLEFNKRDFAAYTGELREFFPQVEIVDVINQFDLASCRRITDISTLAKRVLSQKLEMDVKKDDSKTIEDMIRTYYEPIVIEEMVRTYKTVSVPDSAELTITVTPEGRVSNVRNNNRKLTAVRFNDALIREIGTWRFPASDKEQRINHTIRFRL